MRKKVWSTPQMFSLEEGIGHKKKHGDDDDLRKKCRGNQTRFRKIKQKRCRRRKGTKFS
ncbi:MAG: hypothetical protein ACE5HO_07200 [bacterium]